MGNRLSAADVSGGWLYNENNELLQAGNRAEYKYDAVGNLVEKKTPERILRFEYNLDNHLSRVADSNNATVASYGYDFLRRRIWKDVRGVKTFYHYSDSGLVAEMDASGNVRKSYGYRPGSPWGTDPLFVRENGKNYWYLNDHLGTPQMVVAENGGVVWKAQYQVFGKAEIDGSSTLTNNLRFPGQYYDEETGLYYNWNRYYDPESGRYTQTDKLGIEGGINLYLYANLNILLKFDNQGLKPSIIDLVEYYYTLDEAAREDCKNVIKDKGLSPCCDPIECQICVKKLCEIYGKPGTSTYGMCIIHIHKICAACK